MALEPSTVIRNNILSRLPEAALAAVRPHLTPIDLPQGTVVVQPDQAVETMIFPETGIISIIVVSAAGEKVESGLCGRDGVAPAWVALGADTSPQQSLVQVAGQGYGLSPRIFREALAEHDLFEDIVSRYLYVLSVQVAFTAMSNAVHHIDERLARWLLMCHDRLDGDEISLTHEFISTMLAVRRSSVTTALHALEANQFIRAHRGTVVVRNRKALEEFAGDAYGIPEREYAKLLGPLT